MSIFHTHQWVEAGRHFNPPTAQYGVVGEKYPEPIFWRMLHGYTVILLKCASCGDQKIVEAIGDTRVK